MRNQETADGSERTEGDGRGNEDDRVDRERQSRRPGSDGAPGRLGGGEISGC